MILWYIY